MWYHATTDFGAKTRYWWNRDRDQLVQELLSPLLAKHVVLTTRRGKKCLFNFGSVSYVTIIGTANKLVRPGKGSPPKELRNAAFVSDNNVTEEFVNEIKVLQSSSASRSLIQQALGSTKKQMFVIMQFGDKDLDSAYEGVVKSEGKRSGYKVIRVDEIRNAGHITTQILENIASSEIILAELSGERPNCYYEAGYAHALGKQVIFAVRKKDRVHFDLAGYRFIQWDTEADFRKQLRDRLKAIVSAEEGDN